MGFLDKAKAAATDLAAKADTALANSGMGGPGGAASPEKLLRDLGVIAYLEASAGRPAPEGERERIMGALRDLEARNALPPLVLQTTPPPPGAVPPPPGTVPPAPGAAPPMPGATGTAPPPPPPGPAAPPPPPPSWAKPGEDA